MTREVRLIRVTEFDPEVAPGETQDPKDRMLVVVHSNPVDPDDPSEFAFQIPLLGIATRAETLGWDDYSDVVRMAIQLAVAEINGDELEEPVVAAMAAVGNPYLSPFAVSTADYFSGAALAAENMELSAVEPAAPRGQARATAALNDPGRVTATHAGLDAIVSALRSEQGQTAVVAARSPQAADVLANVANRSADVRSSARAAVKARRANVSLAGNAVHQELDNWMTTNVGAVKGARNWWMNHVMEASGARGILSARIEVASVEAFEAQEAQA